MSWVEILKKIFTNWRQHLGVTYAPSREQDHLLHNRDSKSLLSSCYFIVCKELLVAHGKNIDCLRNYGRRVTSSCHCTMQSQNIQKAAAVALFPAFRARVCTAATRLQSHVFMFLCIRLVTQSRVVLLTFL